MPPPMNEDVLEQAALEWLAAQGYSLAHGPDLAPGMPASERETTPRSCCSAVWKRP